jgi:hypothetical protein
MSASRELLREERHRDRAKIREFAEAIKADDQFRGTAVSWRRTPGPYGD